MVLTLNTGLGEKERKDISLFLSRLLADTYTLYLKTHNFHWNVTGPLFGTLHSMFEGQYDELAEAVDDIAERIRAMGYPAPGTYGEFLELSSIKEDRGPLVAEKMVQHLVEGHETIIRLIRSNVSILEKSQDASTLDLVTQRMQSHEKTAWMLRSQLG